MGWRKSEAVEYLERGGVVVASVFPWAYNGNQFAACLQGEELKPFEHKFQARAFCEKNADKHYAKMSGVEAAAKERATFEAHCEFYVGDTRQRDIETTYQYKNQTKRERVYAQTRRKELMELEF